MRHALNSIDSVVDLVFFSMIIFSSIDFLASVPAAGDESAPGNSQQGIGREEEDAAVKIQAFYRGYQTRRDLADKREIQLHGPGGKPTKKKKSSYPPTKTHSKPPAPQPTPELQQQQQEQLQQQEQTKT